MKPLTGWKRKLLLLFKSEKTLGAQSLMAAYQKKSIAAMKATVINADIKPTSDYESKKIRDLYSHLNHLKTEFHGQPELCYYHSTLVVLLRRRYQVKRTFNAFTTLWENEAEYLLTHLNLRWIISACDSLIDYSDNPARKAILMNAVTLINTLRLGETQRLLVCPDEIDGMVVREEKLAEQRLRLWPLYDGLSYFRAGSDDSLYHLRNRYASFDKDDPLATKILLSVFERLHHSDNAFALMKQLHQGTTPPWWTAEDKQDKQSEK